MPASPPGPNGGAVLACASPVRLPGSSTRFTGNTRYRKHMVTEQRQQLHHKCLNRRSLTPLHGSLAVAPPGWHQTPAVRARDARDGCDGGIRSGQASQPYQAQHGLRACAGSGGVQAVAQAAKSEMPQDFRAVQFRQVHWNVLLDLRARQRFQLLQQLVVDLAAGGQQAPFDLFASQ